METGIVQWCAYELDPYKSLLERTGKDIKQVKACSAFSHDLSIPVFCKATKHLL